MKRVCTISWNWHWRHLAKQERPRPFAKCQPIKQVAGIWTRRRNARAFRPYQGFSPSSTMCSVWSMEHGAMEQWSTPSWPWSTPHSLEDSIPRGPGGAGWRGGEEMVQSRGAGGETLLQGFGCSDNNAQGTCTVLYLHCMYCTVFAVAHAFQSQGSSHTLQLVYVVKGNIWHVVI